MKTASRSRSEARTTKSCSACNQDLPLMAFHKHKSQRLGVRSICRDCRKQSDEYRKTARAALERRKSTFAERHPERTGAACPVCKSWFVPRRRGGSLQKFCSEKCKSKRDNQVRSARHPERVRQWWSKHPGYAALRSANMKEEFCRHYGGAFCSCCGEAELRFLSIDHIHGGGSKHREEIGMSIYKWLRLNSWPQGFRVLCMNCQFGTRYGKTCPHQRSEKLEAK